MKPMVILTFDDMDYVKAMRRVSRNEEITRHGRQIEGRSVKHSSMKAYSRKGKSAFRFDLEN